MEEKNPAHTLSMLVSVLVLLALLLVGFSPFVSVRAVAPGVSPGSPIEKISGEYIVILSDGKVADGVARAHHLTEIHRYNHAFNGLVVRGSQEEMEQLKGDPDVIMIQQDIVVHAAAQTVPTGVLRINAPANPLAGIGKFQRVNAGIAIIDTGIDLTHPDLNVNQTLTKNCLNDTAWAYDGNGHGTHVAGIAAALDNDIGVVGVAPGARLYAVKVLDDSGSGALSSVICGIDWATSHADIIDVVNLSLGATGSNDSNCGLTNNDALHLAICRSVAKGIVYVAAAGNSHADASTFVPAAYPEVIAVSAITDYDGRPGGLAAATCRPGVDDTFADFSNFGQAIALAAPGVCILSTWKGGGYATLSGTSMASPHVAGAAALYIVANGKPRDAAGVSAVRLGLVALGFSAKQLMGVHGGSGSVP